MSLTLPANDGRRPNSGVPEAVDHCFYCGRLHPEHERDCVCLGRAVVIEMTLKYVQRFPALWTKEQIEFNLNESSNCSTNQLEFIANTILPSEPEGACSTCARTQFRYIGEAESEDEDSYPEIGALKRATN